MEKNKNISLDELFARAKGEEPVISQEDVRTIVSSATSPVQSIQQTTSIISRKGFIMTGLGLVGATAALVGYLTMGSSNVIPKESSTEESGISSLPPQTPHVVRGDIAETTTPTNEPKKEVKTAKKIIIVSDNGDGTQLAIDPNVPEPPIPSIPPLLPDGKLMAPVEVEMVSIIQAKDEDLAKLGLEKTSNGDLLYRGKNNDGSVMTITMPINGWGVVTNFVKGKGDESESKLMPTVITDGRGNKHFINYSDENSTLQMQMYDIKIPNDITVDSENGPNIHIQNHKASIVINDDEVTDGKKVRSHTNMRKKIVISHDSSSVDDISELHNLRVDIHIDGEDGMPSNFNFKMNFADSSMDKNDVFREAMSKAKIAMKDLRVKMDSADASMINIQLDKGFKWNGNLPGFDDAIKNIDKEMKRIIVKDKNIEVNGSPFSNEDVIMHIQNHGANMRKMEAKISAKLNSLVPVLVRKATEVKHNEAENRDYDNGVIMWFEPGQFGKQVGTSNQIGGTTDIVNGISNTPNGVIYGQDKASKTTSINEVSVYPNPVRTTKTNIHYKLSEPRSLAFSIHDILGKKIVDCGSLAERPQGEYDFELNIGNIPAGIYLVVITSDKGEQTIQRIAIEK